MKYWIVILLSLNSLYSQVQFQVPGITVSPVNTIELPITIQTNGNTVGSLEFALNYDQTLLQFSEIVLSENAQSWLTYTMDVGDGKVRWGGYDKTFGSYSITSPTELFIIKFTVLDNNWTTTPITVGRKTAGDQFGWDIPVTNTNGYINANRKLAEIKLTSIEGTAYPNPTDGVVYLNITVPTKDFYRLSVIDLGGKELRGETFILFQGISLLEEDLTAYPSGIYLLQIASDSFTKTFKIIKN